MSAETSFSRLTSKLKNMASDERKNETALATVVSHREHEYADNEEWEEFVKATKSTVALKASKRSFRAKLKRHVDSIYVQSFIVLLVVADLILGLTSIVKDEQLRSYITLTIIILYLLEISLRIYAYGPIKYFSSVLDIVDFVAVIGSLILYIYAIYVVYALLVKILRWIRVARTSYRAIFSRSNKIQTAIRNLQRSNLRGYTDDKYDLDVAYITDDILIMSRPAARAINQFSHDCLSDVKNFLDEKHNGCYRIYDLCVYNDSGHDQGASLSAPKDQVSAESLKKSKSGDSLLPHGGDLKSANIDASASYMSLVHLGADTTDSPNIQYETFGDAISNAFSFRSSAVIPLEKLFLFAEQSTQFADEKTSNVIIIQSTNGLGRCMFMCACLLFYYHPTASLNEIMKFIYSERLSIVQKKDEQEQKETDDDLFQKFLPSQTRYLQYFATLILHCYREESANGEMDDEIQEIERNLTQHIQHIQHHHEQSMIDKNVLDALGQADSSKWNFYHDHAQNLLNTKIGVVIKQIGIYNYFEEIDPYVRWEADIFQWIQAENEEDSRLQRIDYDSYTFGVDREPGKNCAVIRRGDDVRPKVLEKDFGIRVFKVVGNQQEQDQDEDDEKKKPVKRKLKAQLILHGHFLNLDEEHKITFSKSEIDFVAKDVQHRHFPQDFHITIEARILKKK